MVLTDAFIQGRDLVMAIPRGAQRFTYMFTLDAKIEKSLTFGRRQVGLILEAYNLTDATIEAEEYVVSGSDFRRVRWRIVCSFHVLVQPALRRRRVRCPVKETPVREWIPGSK